MLQINKMSEAILKLIEDVERLQAEIKELKECSQPVVVPADVDVEAIISSRPGRIVPILYQEGDKITQEMIGSFLGDVGKQLGKQPETDFVDTTRNMTEERLKNGG